MIICIYKIPEKYQRSGVQNHRALGPGHGRSKMVSYLILDRFSLFILDLQRVQKTWVGNRGSNCQQKNRHNAIQDVMMGYPQDLAYPLTLHLGTSKTCVQQRRSKQTFVSSKCLGWTRGALVPKGLRWQMETRMQKQDLEGCRRIQNVMLTEQNAGY